MQRFSLPFRPDYRSRLLDDGFVYFRDPLPDGGSQEYWQEGACYVLSEDQYRRLHIAAAGLHRMHLQALEKVIQEGCWERLGLTPEIGAKVALSYRQKDFDLCGRFDFAWQEGDPNPKMLEYNADSAGTLIENRAAVSWYKDLLQEGGLPVGAAQWNGLEKTLRTRLRRWAKALEGREVQFVWPDENGSGEEFMNTAYIQALALEEGIAGRHFPASELDWDEQGCLYGGSQKLEAVWKFYHWEWLIQGDPDLLETIDQDNLCHVQWVEPLWKLAVSSKGMLEILWEMFPDHPNLLPAYPDSTRLTHWARKPLFSQEGHNIKILSPGGEFESEHIDDFNQWGWVYQQFLDSVEYEGLRPVFGVWIVGSQPAGLTIRESRSLVTDFYCHTVPHIILPDNPQP